MANPLEQFNSDKLHEAEEEYKINRDRIKDGILDYMKYASGTFFRRTDIMAQFPQYTPGSISKGIQELINDKFIVPTKGRFPSYSLNLK